MKANRKNLIFSISFLIMGLLSAILAMILVASSILFWTLLLGAATCFVSGLFFLAEYMKIRRIMKK